MPTTCFLSYTPYHVFGQSYIADKNEKNVLFCVGEHFSREIINAAKLSNTFSDVYGINNIKDDYLVDIRREFSKRKNSIEILEKMNEYEVNRIIVGHDKRIESQTIFEKTKEDIKYCYSEDGLAIYSNNTHSRSLVNNLFRKIIHGNFTEDNEYHGLNSNLDVLYAAYPDHVIDDLSHMRIKSMFDDRNNHRPDFINEYLQKLPLRQFELCDVIVTLPLYSVSERGENDIIKKILSHLQDTCLKIAIKPHPREEDMESIKKLDLYNLISPDIPMEVVYSSPLIDPDIILGPISTTLHTANIFLEDTEIICTSDKHDMDSGLTSFYDQLDIYISDNYDDMIEIITRSIR